MPVAIASTSTAAASASSPTTITKPSGVAVGDLLVIVAGGSQTSFGSGVYASCTGFTAAIQLAGGVRNGFINPDSNLTYLYRIADASDVSATDYSVARGEGGVAMFRITGWTTGNPFIETSEVESKASSTRSIGATEDIPRLGQQILIMAQSNNDGTSAGEGSSGYQITSADANPTWTELIDDHDSSSELGLAVAYATSSDTSTITSWSITFDGDMQGVAGALAIIVAPADDSGTSALLEPNISFFAGNAQANVSGTTSLFQPATLFPAPDGIGSSPTEWTNEGKNSSTWTNEDKSS